MVAAATALPKRSEIEDKYKWNNTSVFESVDAWHTAADEVEALIPSLKAYEGRLAEGPDVLSEFLQLREDAMRKGFKVYFYAAMTSRVDSEDRTATAILNRADSLYSNLRAASAFMDPELLAIGQDTLQEWMSGNDYLSAYHQYVDNLFRNQGHVRSSEVEEVLGLASGPFNTVSEIYSKLTNAELRFSKAVDSNGNPYTVSQSTIRALEQSADRALRKSAHESYTDAYLEMQDTLAMIYLTSLRQDVFEMRVRGFNSSLDAALFNYNIPHAVFDNLINTFKANLPTWHRYWGVRRKALNLPDHQPFDIWAPIASAQPELSYEQAVEFVAQGMQPIGDDYAEAVRRGCLEERWVDVYPNQGKRQGAFSFGTYDTYPFIMMSFDNALTGMSTLAHELGHSMHKYFSCNQQRWVNFMYTLFAAEVASNFNQAMVRAYLQEAKADDAMFQIALIEEAMTNFHRYFLIMPTLARFELEVHTRVENGQGLTAEDMNEICADLFAEAYGDSMTFDRDRVGITWATFGHLYRAYYTYTYATGISAAHELARGILAGEGGAVQRYREFLGMGGLRYPIDALNHAGVDMTQPDAVETTFTVMGNLVDRLESLIKS